MLSEEFEKEVLKRLEVAGIAISKCRSCGRPIIFMKTKEGKHAPMTGELMNHFIDCKDSKYYKTPKK